MNRNRLPAHVHLYRGPGTACSYLPGREATSEWVDPGILHKALYDRLIEFGFRRSGEYVYRPACLGCHACIPVRIPVARFRPRRRDRRCLRRNADLVSRLMPPAFTDEYFALYTRYLAARHPGGGMDDPDPEDFLQFLDSSWAETRFLEIRDREGKLEAVAVTDVLDVGLSAVYTFFDPDESARGLGNFAILEQIRIAREQGREWLYLGYWIADCPKMAYKARFLPQQRRIRNNWIEVDRPGD
ncbi:MAG: arginyltransferase [Gammaproteobacteria bacterium]|nr:MAG: arginyltransferase [Gammaproteobacteria bacterium]